ncbi:MAG: aminotransferase class V-fold PLP-dependent enzyme [Gammaproteobacteria bacterium]|nr:aminotransferase class V-fold PLP-dependent enzyme [Gammaproteobacteria bacterium]
MPRADRQLDNKELAILGEALAHLRQGFDHLPEFDADISLQPVRDVLIAAADRLHDNYPYFHPLYVGQMLKPPHPVARLAYALAMYINPNNHALDGGRASSRMEKEAVAEIGRMFGWQDCLGHLSGGGTMANFEALWVSRELNDGKAIAASSQAHYTHPRLSTVLNVPFVEIDIDSQGRMSMSSLESALQSGGVGTVVVTLGTTAAGAVDPLPQVLQLREQYPFRIHVDTAYGGYFRLADNLSTEATAAYSAISQADSIVIDPHKHGLQPYGCGCVLFRDPAVGRLYQHDSPYTYFSSAELHLGEISLECSRAGASAVALWATMQALPLYRDGEFARSISQCRIAALDLYQGLQERTHSKPLFQPQLDIVSWAIPATTASASSQKAQQIFDSAARNDLHLALASYPRSMCEAAQAVDEWDQDSLMCLRACVMKADHQDWIAQILERLDLAVTELPEH